MFLSTESASSIVSLRICNEILHNKVVFYYYTFEFDYIFPLTLKTVIIIVFLGFHFNVHRTYTLPLNIVNGTQGLRVTTFTALATQLSTLNVQTFFCSNIVS